MNGKLVLKNFHGFDNISINYYVTTDLTSTTRNNCFKIIGNRFRSNEGKHFFFNKIVNIWNSLPAQIVNSITIESFKKLDKHLASVHQINYFIPAYFFLNSCRLHFFLTLLYKFHDSLSILHGIASFSRLASAEGRGRWEGAFHFAVLLFSSNSIVVVYPHRQPRLFVLCNPLYSSFFFCLKYITDLLTSMQKITSHSIDHI